MAITAKIPVIVLSGFLGSGKTTVLNRWLADGVKTAVIINEFGNAGVDQALLKAQDMPLTLLAGGCLCCQIKATLTPTLKNLWMAWQAAEQKPFVRVIIETSGVASPEPILDSLLRDRWVSSKYCLEQVITTLAIPPAMAQIERFAEVKAQIAWADLLVLTHQDLASSEQIKTLNQLLLGLVPSTPQLLTSQADFALQDLQSSGKAAVRRLPRVDLALTHGFQSVSVYWNQGLPKAEFMLGLSQLVADYGQQLVRVKGVVFWPDHAGQAWVVHAANGCVYPVSALPNRDLSEQASRLVLISDGELVDLRQRLVQWLKLENPQLAIR